MPQSGKISAVVIFALIGVGLTVAGLMLPVYSMTRVEDGTTIELDVYFWQACTNVPSLGIDKCSVGIDQASLCEDQQAFMAIAICLVALAAFFGCALAILGLTRCCATGCCTQGCCFKCSLGWFGSFATMGAGGASAIGYLVGAQAAPCSQIIVDAFNMLGGGQLGNGFFLLIAASSTLFVSFVIAICVANSIQSEGGAGSTDERNNVHVSSIGGYGAMATGGGENGVQNDYPRQQEYKY